jgi:hypothetical protein
MYNIFDISIESDLHLPELPEGAAREAVIEIKAGVDNKRVYCEPEQFHAWKDTNDEICMLSAKIEDNYLLRFPELADFLITSSGDTISYFIEPNIPEETIRHLILDQLIPRILGQRGYLILHASAVQLRDGKAIVFLGGTGWGKSTIASSYYENGAKLITDDCLLIKIMDNKVFCVPNYHGLRLYPDSAEAIFKENIQYEPVAHYTSKERLVLHRTGPVIAEPVPVSAIFLLSDPDMGDVDTVSIKKIRGAKEIMAIVEQTFLMDIEDKDIISKQFTNASELNEVSPVLYGLSYPRKYEMLAEVRNTVEKTAANLD